MNESTTLYKAVEQACFPKKSLRIQSEELVDSLRLSLDQCSLLCEILQSSLNRRDKGDKDPKDVDVRQIAALLNKFRHHRTAQVAALWCRVVGWFCAPGGDDVDTTNLKLLSSMVSFEDMMIFEELSEDGGGIMGQTYDGAEKWAMEQLVSALSPPKEGENKCDRPSASALAIMIEMASRDLGGADCRKIVSLVCANFSVAEIREIIKELGRFSVRDDVLLGPDTNKSMIDALEAMLGFCE